MSKTKSSIIAISLVLVSAGLTYIFAPKKIEYKEKIKIVEVVNTEIRTITRNEKRSDGTVITTTTKEQIKEVSKSNEKEVSKKVTPIKKDWFVTGTYSIDNQYSLAIQRRIVFDLYLGVYARSDRELGISMSYNF